MIARADAARLPLESASVDLVIGSPPYVDARLYLEDGKDLGIARGCREWVDWMLGVTAEALRVSRGLVLWVVAGKTEDWCYQPAPEGLAWRWFSEGWTERGKGTAKDGSAFRPCIWHRSGIPGSGGDPWYRADVEYALCVQGGAGRRPVADPLVNGHRRKFTEGGSMSNRKADGSRVTSEPASGSAAGARAARRSAMRRRGLPTGWRSSPRAPIPATCFRPARPAVGISDHGWPMNRKPRTPSKSRLSGSTRTPRPAASCATRSAARGSTWQACKELGRRFIGFDAPPKSVPTLPPPHRHAYAVAASPGRRRRSRIDPPAAPGRPTPRGLRSARGGRAGRTIHFFGFFGRLDDLVHAANRRLPWPFTATIRAHILRQRRLPGMARGDPGPPARRLRPGSWPGVVRPLPWPSDVPVSPHAVDVTPPPNCQRIPGFSAAQCRRTLRSYSTATSGYRLQTK
jgi:hypothetical protein